MFFLLCSFDLYRKWNLVYPTKESDQREITVKCPVFIEAKYSGENSGTYFTTTDFVNKVALFLKQMLSLECASKQFSINGITNVLYLVFSAQEMTNIRATSECPNKFEVTAGSSKYSDTLFLWDEEKKKIDVYKKVADKDKGSVYTKGKSGDADYAEVKVSELSSDRKRYILIEKNGKVYEFTFFIGNDLKVDFLFIAGKEEIVKAFGKCLGNRPQYFCQTKSLNEAAAAAATADLDKFLQTLKVSSDDKDLERLLTQVSGINTKDLTSKIMIKNSTAPVVQGENDDAPVAQGPPHKKPKVDNT